MKPCYICMVGQRLKINGQTAEKNRSKNLTAIAAVTIYTVCGSDPPLGTFETSSVPTIEHFHHVIKNDVSLYNSVILLCMTAVLVYQ